MHAQEGRNGKSGQAELLHRCSHQAIPQGREQSCYFRISKYFMGLEEANHPQTQVGAEIPFPEGIGTELQRY